MTFRVKRAWGSAQHPTPSDLFDVFDVRGIRALITLSDLKLHNVAVLKRTWYLVLVDEYVLAPIGRSNESEPLCWIKPLYGALHDHKPSWVAQRTEPS